MLQVLLTEPWYFNAGDNHGGQVDIGLLFYNQSIKKHINYVINLYHSHHDEDERLNTIDPNTNAFHVTGVLKHKTRYTTLSPYSKKTRRFIPMVKKDKAIHFENFFRVNISTQNFQQLLDDLHKQQVFGKDKSFAKDWALTAVMLFNELEENAPASLGGAFHAFEAYLTDKPY